MTRTNKKDINGSVPWGPHGPNKIQNLIVKDGETEDETFKVAFMEIHEGWNPKTMANDIAILKLDGSITRFCIRSIHINICMSAHRQLIQYASPRHLRNSLTGTPLP